MFGWLRKRVAVVSGSMREKKAVAAQGDARREAHAAAPVALAAGPRYRHGCLVLDESFGVAAMDAPGTATTRDDGMCRLRGSWVAAALGLWDDAHGCWVDHSPAIVRTEDADVVVVRPDDEVVALWCGAVDTGAPVVADDAEARRHCEDVAVRWPTPQPRLRWRMLPDADALVGCLVERAEIVRRGQAWRLSLATDEGSTLV